MSGRDRYRSGCMAVVEPGYHNGIWLRSDPDVGRSDSSARISPESCVLIVDARGESVLVVGEGGIVGWTWKNRLRPLE